MKVNRAVVYAESVGAYPELCSGAASLAEEVVALVVGSEADAAAVAALGVPVRLINREPGVWLDAYWSAVCDQVAELGPELVLLRASTRVRALAGRLAVAGGLPVASDVSALTAQDAGIGYRVVRYGGATEQAGVAERLVAIVGPGLFPAAQPSGGGSVTVVDAMPASGGVRLVSATPKAEESVDLGASDVVVGVGRGIGSQENLAKAAEFARAIGAELACSRPIAEGLGWLPKNRYLGVSGVVIQPEVYLALGISGQVQHLVGVNGSKAIVAINKDAGAPIFTHCDLGLVADLDGLLPELAERLG
jgi:electron transfer flavoprotein alpha subunit